MESKAIWMVIISLKLICGKRRRRLFQSLSNCLYQIGSKTWQKSSTEQKSSSRLDIGLTCTCLNMVNLQRTGWSLPYPELTLSAVKSGCLSLKSLRLLLIRLRPCQRHSSRWIAGTILFQAFCTNSHPSVVALWGLYSTSVLNLEVSSLIWFRKFSIAG